jgi:hypothetical protein
MMPHRPRAPPQLRACRHEVGLASQGNTDFAIAQILRASGAKVGAQRRQRVIVLGVILLILGFLSHVSILWTLGIILLIIGAVLWILGSSGRAIGGRRHYW